MEQQILLGRDVQKEKLTQLLSSKSPEFVVIYGRRRVGKTFLIRQFYKPNIVFDFTGSYQVPLRIQLDNFYAEYLNRTRGQKETSPPKNWNHAFRYLADYLKTLTKSKRHVVFLDELPWLDTHKSGFVPAIEHLWNQHVSQMDHIVLVVCGSATSWIQNKIFQNKGGLYNRTTARIKLEPFTLKETEQYLKSKHIKLTRYQIIEIYMAMGGIPHYLKEVNPGQSPQQIIDAICFNPNGLLYNEFDQLYPSIFNNYENHLAVIDALALHPQGLTRALIIKHSKLPDGGIITRSLSELEDSGFISLHLPLDKKKRNAVYKLADMYSLFYFKFIKNNKKNGEGTWQRLSQTQSYISWSGYAYENICYQHIDQVKKALGISGIYTNTVSWSFKGNEDFAGVQIDLLIDRDDRMINLVEVKFSKNEFLINKEYAKKLRKKVHTLEHITQTKKSIILTLMSTYAAIKNEYYLEQIQSEVTMDALFD